MARLARILKTASFERCGMRARADKGTGKKQDIKITGASTLASDEVDRMVKDAEKFADEVRMSAECRPGNMPTSGAHWKLGESRGTGRLVLTGSTGCLHYTCWAFPTARDALLLCDAVSFMLSWL